jgi:hypothetical protein
LVGVSGGVWALVNLPPVQAQPAMTLEQQVADLRREVGQLKNERRIGPLNSLPRKRFWRQRKPHEGADFTFSVGEWRIHRRAFAGRLDLVAVSDRTQNG